ncbi:XRE family transcriptional regulator [Kitasatospora purpeofusca]|uniref:XRE family transcriptional regulator n=1 Tax=Kitasatospora TaxID=2063 RepID=UPI0005BA9624|nr:MULTISPECIES: XRE family transcriptional regulator [Kitasatospora]MCX4753052.1 helix-turn-helix domain-containing protein [Kitasatospora purpeofusca]WSR32585.1 helix-turn-helix domain-containing protein [Kitasatospora purpeofusca]WSR40675.1 helix-turn-helix domain-containing protein [Kitasatospora purpeofusca]BEK66126.1 helix-turn-helix domain-containing protein [Kitasatospora purpeofusca]
MARSWKEVRPEVVTDEARVAAHRAKLDAEVRAYRLAEIRKEQALTQVEVAEIIGVTQPNVSRLEKGDLDGAALATIRAYVEALGGRLRLVADFGDRQLVIQ